MDTIDLDAPEDLIAPVRDFVQRANEVWRQSASPDVRDDWFEAHHNGIRYNSHYIHPGDLRVVHSTAQNFLDQLSTKIKNDQYLGWRTDPRLEPVLAQVAADCNSRFSEWDNKPCEGEFSAHKKSVAIGFTPDKPYLDDISELYQKLGHILKSVVRHHKERLNLH